jgi:diketogulonate reductase-like aldo/keto reductase
MKLPQILYGTCSHGTRTADVTTTALKAGFEGLDSALSHPYDEESVGRALTASSSKDLWIQTKFTPQGEAYSTVPGYDQQVEQSLLQSLKLLNESHIDSYLLHGPLMEEQENLSLWQAINLLSYSFAARIGVSNFSVEQLEQLIQGTGIKPAAVQNHIGLEHVYLVVLEYCLEKAIMYQGFGFLRSGISNHPTIIEIATAHQVSSTQVLVSFLESIGVTPIIGSSQEKRIQESLLASELRLSREEVRRIAAINGDTKSEEKVLSIFDRLQTQDLMTLQSIITTLQECPLQNLNACLSRVSKYVPLLDPMSLAEIIAAQDNSIIQLLKEHGADFSRFNHLNIKELLTTKPTDILLQDLGIAPEKLLAPLLERQDIQGFEALFEQSDLQKLPKYEIAKILQLQPKLAKQFLESNVAKEDLLTPLAKFCEESYFNEAFEGVDDFNRLSSSDMIAVIDKKGPGIINEIKEKGANFTKLSPGECGHLVTYGPEVVSLVIAIAPNLKTYFLPHLANAGYRDLFYELAKETDLSLLKTKAIETILRKEKAALDMLINSQLDRFSLFIGAMNVNLDLARIVIKRSDLSQLFRYTVEYMLNNGIELLEDFMQSNINKLYLVSYVLKTYRTKDDPNSFSPINKLDLSISNQDLSARFYVEKLVKNEGPLVLGALARAGFNFTKFSYYDIRGIVENSADKILAFQEMRFNFNNFDRYDIKTLVEPAADKILAFQKLKAGGAKLLELLEVSSELSPYSFKQLVKEADASVFGNSDWNRAYTITSLIEKFSRHVNPDLQLPPKLTKEIANAVVESNSSDPISQFAECIVQECSLDNACTSAGIIDCYRSTQQHDEL